MPIDAAEATTKAKATKGMTRPRFIRESSLEIARVRARDKSCAGDGEEKRADDAVRKHLQDRAGNA